MQGLAHLKNATTVDVSWCNNLTDAGLVHLKKATTVDLRDCSQITDEGIQYLKSKNIRVYS